MYHKLYILTSSQIIDTMKFKDLDKLVSEGNDMEVAKIALCIAKNDLNVARSILDINKIKDKDEEINKLCDEIRNLKRSDIRVSLVLIREDENHNQIKTILAEEILTGDSSDSIESNSNEESSNDSLINSSESSSD